MALLEILGGVLVAPFVSVLTMILLLASFGEKYFEDFSLFCNLIFSFSSRKIIWHSKILRETTN